MGFKDKVLLTDDILSSVTIAFLVITTISVALRVLVRAGILRTFRADDWTLLLAQLLFIATCSLTFPVIEAQRKALHGSQAPDRHALTNVRLVNSFYCLTMIVLKISLGLFFLQLFTINHKWQRVYIHAIVLLSTTIGLVYAGLTLFSCGLKNSQDPNYQCDMGTAYTSISSLWSFLNFLTDLSFSALAVMLLWNLSLPRRAKISTCALLVFGTIGGIASLMRIVVQYVHLPAALEDITVGRWSCLEAGIGITTVSLATTRPLYRKMVEVLQGRKSSSTTRIDTSNDTFMEYTQRTLSGAHSMVRGGGANIQRPPMCRADSKDIFVTMEVQIQTQSLQVVQTQRADSLCVPPKAILYPV